MVGSKVSLGHRVVGAYGAAVGTAILLQSVFSLITAMKTIDSGIYGAIAGVAVGSSVVIVGMMIVFGSIWATTSGKVTFPIAAIYCGLKYGATGELVWALAAGTFFVLFVLLLRKPKTRETAIDTETSGTRVGTIH